jgi:hypothetical protein
MSAADSGDSGLLMGIFMPLIFLDDKERERMRDEGATVLYGRTSGAVRQLNGYPCLDNMGWLTDREWQRVAHYVAAMDAAVNAAVNAVVNAVVGQQEPQERNACDD